MEVDEDKALSGLEIIQMFQAGALKVPLNDTLRIVVEEVRPGHAEVVFDPQEDIHGNGFAVHGGATAAVLDDAMGLAALSLLTGGNTCVTRRMAIEFDKAVKLGGGLVRAIGTCSLDTQRNGSLFPTATLVDEQGEVLATSTGEFRIIPPDRRL